MSKQSLTADRLREHIHYDPLTGIFTRKIRTAQRHQVGDRADKLIVSGNAKGYRRVALDGKRYLAHRVAVLYMTGEWPGPVVDHWDGDKGNNIFKNLRDVPRFVNQENIRKPRADNACGFLGVHAHQNGWRARLSFAGKTINLGVFETPERAHAEYVAAKRKYHTGCTL